MKIVRFTRTKIIMVIKLADFTGYLTDLPSFQAVFTVEDGTVGKKSTSFIVDSLLTIYHLPKIAASIITQQVMLQT